MSDFEAFDLGRQSKAQPMNVPFTNSGHGHAWTRPDGVKARCGGVLLCTQCLFDSAEMRKAQTATSPQWQPIETAPKNTECEFLGPVIIATAGHAPSFVRWSSTLGDWEAAHGQRDPITGLHQFPRVKTQPTHWMPLPSAPIAKDSASNLSSRDEGFIEGYSQGGTDLARGVVKGLQTVTRVDSSSFANAKPTA